jgi:hypothetical protein
MGHRSLQGWILLASNADQGATEHSVIAYSHDELLFSAVRVQNALSQSPRHSGVENELDPHAQYDAEPFTIDSASPHLLAEAHSVQGTETEMGAGPRNRMAVNQPTGLPHTSTPPRLLTPAQITDNVAVEDNVGSLEGSQAELFLLRHYSEYIAPW